MKQIFQNINKVEYIETKGLNGIVLISNHEVCLQYWRNFKELCIVGLASVEVSQTIEYGSRLNSIKMEAHTTEDFHVDHRRLAWRVTTVEGRQFLIGIKEQPYPITTVADSYPDKATDRSGKTITVTWKTPLEMLEIK